MTIHDMTAVELLAAYKSQETFARRSRRRRHQPDRGLGAEAEGALRAGFRGRAQDGQGVGEALAGRQAAGRAGRRADHHQGEHRHQGRAGAARHARRPTTAPAAGGRAGRGAVREAGAVILGKTTMPDYGMLSSGVELVPCADAQSLEPRCNPGGSSAGAGAPAAAGYGAAASRHRHRRLGAAAGDAGTASSRSSPVLGRVPVDPPYIGRVVGPMTRTVADSALLMAELSKPDARDHMSLPPADIDWTAGPLEPKGLRIGAAPRRRLRPAGRCRGQGGGRGGGQAVRRCRRHRRAGGAFLSPEMLHLQDLFWRVRSWVDFSALSHARQASVLPFIADWCRGGADVSGAMVIKGVNNYMAIRAAATKATHARSTMCSRRCRRCRPIRAEWETPTNDVKRPLEHISFTMPYNMSEQPAASINCGYTQGRQADRPADRRPPLRRSRRDAPVALVRDGARAAEEVAGIAAVKVPLKRRVRDSIS